MFVIFVATLRPAGDSLAPGWTLALVSGDEALAELIQNLLLFVPLGAALAFHGMRGARVIACGALLSFSVEFIQQMVPGRDPSVGDIVANTISTGLGAGLVWTAPRWLAPPPRLAPWLSLAAAVVAAAVWLATGWLFQPDLPRTTYYDRWTPDIPNWDNYPGRVIAATLGPVALERGPIPGGRTLLAAGEPVQLTLVAGRAPDTRCPLLIISDEAQRDILTIGVDRTDLLVAYRTHATALRLDLPDLRIRGALASVAPADTFTVSTAQFAGLGRTAGEAWQLIFFPEHFPPWALAFFNASWIAGGVLLVGVWGRRHPATLAALGALAATLAVGPSLVRLDVTPVTQWLGAACGFAAGRAILMAHGFWLSSAPSRSSRRDSPSIGPE